MLPWLIMLSLSLVGCVSAKTITLDMANCDPRQRDDCMAISQDALDEMTMAYEQNVRLKAALKTCREKL